MTTSRFSSGLRLIVRPARTHRLVAFRCYIRGGSIAEWPDGGSGAAHLLEHLAATRIGRELQRRTLGALLHASIARDYTCLAGKATPVDAAPSLRIVLDGIHTGMPDAERPRELDAQRQVVLEELRPHEADPLRQFQQHFLEQLLVVHPARYPVSGTAARVRTLDLADLDTYRQRVYRDGNLCIVAVGDCEPEALLGVLQASPLDLEHDSRWALPLDATEPPRTGECAFAIARDGAAHDYTEIGFVTPGTPSADVRALETLRAQLNGDANGPLRLALQDLAGNLIARQVNTAFGIGFFSILIEHASGAGTRVETILRHWLDRIAQEEPLLNLAWRDRDATGAMQQRPLDEQAAQLGLSELREGDPLAAEQAALAERPLRLGPIAAAVRRHAASDLLLVGHLGARITAAGSSAPRRPQQTRPTTASGAPNAHTLANGIRLIALPSMNPVSCCQIVGLGGVWCPPPLRLGTCQLMTDLWPAQFAPFSDQHMFGLSLIGSEEEVHAGVDALLACILHPRYTAADVTAVRGRLAASVRQPPTGWKFRARCELRRALFGDRPYGRSQVGTHEILLDLTLTDVERCHRQLCTGANLVVAVSGRAATDGLRERLAAGLGALERGVPVAAPAADLTDRAATGVSTGSSRRLDIAGNAPATPWLALGYRGIAWRLDDWIALELARTLLVGPTGGLATGRLIERLRSEGLAYAVDCLNRPGLGDGSFSVLAACDHGRGARIVALIEAEIDALRTGAFSEAELAFSRKLQGLNHVMLDENPRRQAFLAAHHALLSGDPEAWFRGAEAIVTATADQVIAACQRLLVDPNKVVLVADCFDIIEPSAAALLSAGWGGHGD